MLFPEVSRSFAVIVTVVCNLRLGNENIVNQLRLYIGKRVLIEILVGINAFKTCLRVSIAPSSKATFK